MRRRPSRYAAQGSNPRLAHTRQVYYSTHPCEPCLGQLAAEAKTGGKTSRSSAADLNAENADPQLRFVTERRPNRKPLEAAAREHTAAAAQEAGLTSLTSLPQELSGTPEPRTKPPLHITLPLQQPACEAEGAAPAAAGQPEDVELRRLRRPPEDEELAQISPQLAQMQISPQQISPDTVTAQMEISPLRAADLADSPFAQIAKKMREAEAGRSPEMREAEAGRSREVREDEASQLASPSPRAAQCRPMPSVDTPEKMRFSPEAAAAPEASDERAEAASQPSLLKLEQQPSDGSRRMLRRMTRSPQIQATPMPTLTRAP